MEIILRRSLGTRHTFTKIKLSILMDIDFESENKILAILKITYSHP